MKLFQVIKMGMDRVGIRQLQPFQKSAFNLRNIQVFICLCLSGLSFGLFFVLEASKFGEYCESFYGTVTYVLAFLITLQLIQNTSNIFKLINNFESFIQTRKIFLSSKSINCISLITIFFLYFEILIRFGESIIQSSL